MAKLSPDETRAAQRRNLFWRGQVFPRWRQLLGLNFWLPVLSAATLTLACAWSATTVRVNISDVADFGMTYSTLSLAACVTGVVLAIGLPSGDRMRRWTSSRPSPTAFSAYGDLIFALTWAGIAQFLILLVSVAALIIGGNEELLPTNPKSSHLLLLVGSVAAFFYAVNQLLVLIYTFSQIGNVIDIDEWANRNRSTSPDDAAQPDANMGPFIPEVGARQSSAQEEHP